MKNIKCNKYDKVCMNIDEIFKRQDFDLGKTHKFDKNSSTKEEYKIKAIAKIIFLAKMYFIGGLLKLGIFKKLIYLNLVSGWFEEFRKFWVDYLGNHPIDIIDFHFLRLNYLVKFKAVSFKDKKNSEEVIKVYQGRESVYLAFHCVWNYARSGYLYFYPFLKYIPDNSHILEYGCGIAPITKGLIEYCPHKNLRFTIADIKQISFCYARWNFATKNYVNFITINPTLPDNLPANEKYDIILCLTVFEHLPNPHEVMELFNNHLRSGGVLIFDYIKGEGTGLDTQEGVTERKKVLKFIEDNFTILKGKIDYENTMGLTIAKKFS